MVGDEEVFPQEKIELGGHERIDLGVIDGVHDEVGVVAVGLDLRKRGVAHAVLDGERVELEGAAEDLLDFLGGGRDEIDPEHDARLVAQDRKHLDRGVLRGEAVVAIDEGGDHAAGRSGSSNRDGREGRETMSGR